MIDEKKLIESLRSSLNTGRETFPIDLIVECIEEQPKIGEWIPCSERMPENEVEVEITYTRNGPTGDKYFLIARAFYEDGTMNTEDSDYVWFDKDNWKYDEDKDAYIIPEGWWEEVKFGEEFGVVDMPVIAWKPLPEPYKEQEEKQDGNKESN